METILSILKYVGLAITSLMAILSLFFEFTRVVRGSSQKRLTRPGKIALAIMLVSIVVSFAANITEDIANRRNALEQTAEQARLTREIKLSNHVFESIELHLAFDTSLDWQDKTFLSAALSEFLYGSWNMKTGLVYSHWSLNKLTQKQASHRTVLYVDTRPKHIRTFVEQNAPHLLRKPPTAVSFFTDEKGIKGYNSPAALYLDQFDGPQFSRVSFSVDTSPQEQVFYENERKGLIFSIHFSKRYAEILDSEITLNFGFTAPGFLKVGPTPFDRQPSTRPYIADHLKAIHLYLDGQDMGEVYRAQNATTEISSATSEWGIEHNEFGASLIRYRLTRATILSQFNPDEEGRR